MSSLYFRKWTRMEWWDSVRYFKKYNLLEYKEEHRQLHLFPPQWQKYLPTNHQLREICLQDKKDKQLVHTLFQRYPDLRYDTSGRVNDRSGASDSYQNYAVRFVLKQKELMKQGLSEGAAFQQTEKLFQDRMQRKIDQNNLTRGIAINNRARSFMNFYQQQAEREARWKVQRMQRDVHQYLEERKTFEKEIEDDGDMEEDFAEEENMYNRVLIKMENQGVKEQKGDEKTSVHRDFVERSENMFKVYYERAAIYDRLQGLTDSQIQAEINNSPSKMKKRTRTLLRKLEKLGVTLKETGEVDFSQVKNANLRKKLESDSTIRSALMLKDLEFEHAHKEHQMEEASNLKHRLSEVQDSRASYVKDIMEIAGQPFKMKEPMFSYESTHDTREENAQRAKEAKLQGEQYLEKAYTDSLLKPIIQSPATYKLFESYEERILRIEEKWLRRQIQISDQQNWLFVVCASEDTFQKEERLQAVVDKLRRTKYKIDQLSTKNAQDLMFEEHEVFGDTILMDEQVGYEDLRNYLFQPHEEKRKTEQEALNDSRISEMIKMSTIKEDLKHPYSNDFGAMYKLSDTVEFKEMKAQKVRKLKAEREKSETDPSKADAISQFGLEDGGSEEGGLQAELIGSISKRKVKGSKEKKGKQDSMGEEGEEVEVDEKKKILDFIKKANEKSSKPSPKSKA